MDDKQIFSKYYTRLAGEGKLKALIFGLIVGFGLSIIPAIITFFLNYNGLWISLGAGVFGVLCAFPLFYRFCFRPSVKQIAQRVDRLGLDERLITMLELEKNESYIALRQREDAKQKLKSVSSRRLKLSILKAPVIACVVLFVSASALITLSAVSTEPPVGWKSPVNSIPVEDYDYIRVKYLAGEGGSVKENDEQNIRYNTDAQAVLAVPDIGYAFVGWSDGIKTIERADKKVKAEISVTAMFEKYQEPPPPPDDPEDKPKNTAAYEERNKIKNGETYYGDVYKEEFYEPAMENLSTDSEKSSDMRDVIEMYLESLK